MGDHGLVDEPSKLKQRLESLALAGVQQLPKARSSEPVATRAMKPRETSPSPDASDAPATTGFRPLALLEPDDLAERQRRLDALRAEVAGCTKCAELAAARHQTVFGTGHAAARICFMGEAPGADEDASGEPFVGRAGQLLTKIIEACTLSRESVFILNVLKCRPPGNRPPLPDEVAHCRGYFERQLAIIEPAFIVCLGTTAAQALLQTTATIGKLRGEWHRHGNADVICTYHPSYLLRNPAAKRDVWEDMKRLMERVGVSL
jgi:uracil-DNA glycosylase family 4